MADEITSIAEAFNAAKLDHDSATPADGDITPPAVEQAEPIDIDQSEASNPELQQLFDSVEAPVPAEDSTDTESTEFWNKTVQIGDGVSVSLSQLRDGYMMQADYTQKTQAVAAHAKQLNQADQFYQSYQANPQEFARAVAVQQGWLADDASTPITDVPGAVPESAADTMANVEKLVEERMAADPRMAQARQLEARATIDAKFTDIEQRLGVTIPNAVRGEIVLDASRRHVYDLDLITEHWMSQQRDRHRSGAQLKQGASARPQSAGATASEDAPQEVSTFADAVLAARAQLNAGA